MENKNIIIILIVAIVVLAAVIGFILMNPTHTKVPCKIKITSDKEQYKGGKLSVQLTGLNNTPLSKEVVNVTVTDKKGKVVVDEVVKTNSKGKAKLDLKLKKMFGIEQDVFYADIHWTDVVKAIRKNKLQFSEISKYPAVSRDLALLLDKDVEFAQIEQIARQTEKKLLKKVELFDVYEGKNLPAGKKSYAVNFILQDETKTLNDKAIEAIMNKLIHQLTTKLNAELR